MVLAFSLVLAGTVSALTTGAWFFDTETCLIKMPLILSILFMD